MSGTDTTYDNARRPQEGPEHVVKERRTRGVLRPCLRGTVECGYHEREVQDTRPINPRAKTPLMCRSLAHPGSRRPALLEMPSLISSSAAPIKQKTSAQQISE
jgi:hypothetical protein